MSETKRPYLTVMRAARDPGPEPEPAPAGGDGASSVLGQIVMHACMAWTAGCMELDAHTVDVCHVGPGVFTGTVHLIGGQLLTLQVATKLSSGPVLELRIEPLHP